MTDQRILRAFIKPAGFVWVDIPLAPASTMVAIFDVWKRDGALCGTDVIVPWDAVLYAATLQVPIETMRPAQVYPFPPKEPA